MAHRPDHGRKPRRVVALAAALALMTALSGCVIYPAGPGYGYYGRPYHDHYYWR
jgi:hypothetical protein